MFLMRVFIQVLEGNMTVEQAIKEYKIALQKARQARKEATDAQTKAEELELEAQIKHTAVIDAQYEAKKRGER